MVCPCLKVYYTARHVALHSHRFYVTLACECPLLMVVLLRSQKLDFFVVILRMHYACAHHTKLTKFNWEAHQIQLGSSLIQLLGCSPVLLAYITYMLFL